MTSIAAPQSGLLRQYFVLTKPRVTQLAVFCAVIGMFLAAPGIPDMRRVLFGTIGIWLLAAAAFAINCLIEQEVDARMLRTARRATARGTISAFQVLSLSGLLGGAGMFVLYHLVNPLTMWLTFATFVGYAVIWTPPHFWALAIFRNHDYAKAGLPMLPVTHGNQFTRLHILLYSVALMATTLLPYAIRMSGELYLASALALGGMFVSYAWRLYRAYSDELARSMFRFSILYLALLFGALLADHWVGLLR